MLHRQIYCDYYAQLQNIQPCTLNTLLSDWPYAQHDDYSYRSHGWRSWVLFTGLIHHYSNDSKRKLYREDVFPHDLRYRIASSSGSGMNISRYSFPFCSAVV